MYKDIFTDSHKPVNSEDEKKRNNKNVIIVFSR